MRLPHPRFTVRRLMVAVAVVGAVIGIPLGFLRSREAWFRERASWFRERAALHAREAAWLDRYPGAIEIMRAEFRDHSRLPKMGAAEEERRYEAAASTRIYRRTEWHKLLRDKYQNAARYPWLPVAPDPPEPQ